MTDLRASVVCFAQLTISYRSGVSARDGFSKTLLKPKLIAPEICILVLAIFGFFSNEARKEVYFFVW
ncbi:hypothetical protein ISG33_13600 [Glaciecola sp. MH2013]|uniref:hypothetical protein n=1 Tax=Glaciecola sp. MH2013 TaxID=2785524 RepID=UPI00189D1436|nr:hypothetical protein [Glaciecola sp. MH2013]MBF7074436.1 hypothetical protein [Glaciecola sp. MH2013]